MTERPPTKPIATFPRNASAGPLAIDPRAFGWLFFEPFEDPGVETRPDGIAVVRIRGPLEHHAVWHSDSYDAIAERFDAAIAAKPKGILLAIDSPGGLVAGCFELAEHMRHESAEHGIPLYAYAEGMCCSAAFALACSASRFGASKSSMIGSIGVVDCLVDASAVDEMWGVKYRLITSGARKGDGNPHQPVDDGAILATQQRVDDLAEQFFAWVGAARPALGADGARSLEAAVHVGTRAYGAGLLDVLGDPSVLLDESTTENLMPPTQPKAEDEKPADDSKPEEKASDGDMYRKLRKMADEGDEDAKKMLDKLEAPADEPADDEKKAEDEGEEDAKALARAALAGVERIERASLIATRPDLTDAERALLATSTLKAVRAYVGAAPKRSPPDRAAAAQPGVRPKAQPAGAQDRPALALTPPTTENDRARHAMASRLLGHTSTIVGATVARDGAGRVAKVEFGVDRELAPGEKNPDRLAAVRLRGAPALGGLDGGTKRVA